MENEIAGYGEKVYAGVLGKVIGVYLGRPIEGMRKADIEKTLGQVDRYVHTERGVPLVVSDDDITGTFTFIRALEDSGLGLAARAADFGRAWLNYLVEGKTVLWWGGRGLSTEHTAFLNLKAGIEAPRSGSMAQNGRVVAEQIGAQIFIDAVGLVTPGKPELAARLAAEAARVSHDGEAVYGAQVVAAMVSAAFTEPDMEKLLDIGVSFIPNDCLIAQIHRDVRTWSREDRNWHRTFQRISEKWGYQKYGGNCHILPNHALMVLAWAHAGQDFRLAQTIVNTCGWDTDCNAANVGCVMGVSLGLSAMSAPYDFQAPFADRIVLPTAEGTHGVSDALLLAERLARLGRSLMGWKPAPEPKGGAWHHFSMPGSRHGWMSEALDEKRPGLCAVSNQGGKLRISTPPLSEGRDERIATPLLSAQAGGGYAVMGCPKLYPGQRVLVHGHVDAAMGSPQLRLFLRHFRKETRLDDGCVEGQVFSLEKQGDFTLNMEVPDFAGFHPTALGLAFSGKEGAQAVIRIDRVCVEGAWAYRLQEPLRRDDGAPGWIHAVSRIAWGFSDDPQPLTRIVQDSGLGVLATGSLDWKDYRVSARLSMHTPGVAGLVARYQGLGRMVALERSVGSIRLVETIQGNRKVLGELETPWELDTLCRMEIVCVGEKVRVTLDGKALLEGRTALLSGGAGILADETNAGFREFEAASL